MKTAIDSHRSQPTHMMPALALISLLAAGLVAGCGELPAHDSLSVQEASMTLMEPCPTGTCTNPTNGRGIYVSNLSGYCFLTSMAEGYFCPEAFTHQPDGTVVLTGQRVPLGQDFPETQENVSFSASAWWGDRHVVVSDIKAGATALAVTVQEGSTQQILSGSDLDALVLGFPKGEPKFLLRFRAPQKENGVTLYRVEYYLSGGSEWQPYCQDGEGTAALLPGRRVDSVTAQVTGSADGFTMACRTGAIAACMVWGYRPWEAQELADTLYGSCLQAKRAAYFVSQGDYRSYTVKGTPISLQDKSGIQQLAMPGVEALWTPRGASCLSPEFRRIPVQGSGPLPELPKGLEPCNPRLHAAVQEGTLRDVLQDTAPLATGPAI